MIETAVKSKVELILEEFKKTKNKTQLIKFIADKHNRSAQGIKNNWFYGFNTIPAELQEQVLVDMLQYNQDHD
jgi:hypothetical protein